MIANAGCAPVDLDRPLGLRARPAAASPEARRFDVCAEDLAVHRPFDDERRNHSVMTQARDEGDSLPLSMRSVVDQAVAARAASPGSHHAGGDGGLIEKDQRGGIQQALLPAPAPARTGYIGPVLLAGVQCFF